MTRFCKVSLWTLCNAFASYSELDLSSVPDESCFSIGLIRCSLLFLSLNHLHSCLSLSDGLLFISILFWCFGGNGTCDTLLWISSEVQWCIFAAVIQVLDPYSCCGGHFLRKLTSRFFFYFATALIPASFLIMLIILFLHRRL